MNVSSLFRVFALIIGVLAAILGMVINLLYSTTHNVLRLSGASNVATTHGWIGLGLVVLGFIGALLAVARPMAAAALMLIAGIGLFFVLRWFGIFVGPFFLVAAAMAFLDRPGARATAPRTSFAS
ncbi:MAG: hypothetical protein IVW57_01620 [Ktedonobacterales bacterium]|nr:hypothetical protein [Ktedonobacterales bacterium]